MTPTTLAFDTGAGSPPREAGPFTRIVLVVAEGAPGANALAWTRRLADASAARVWILHVAEPPAWQPFVPREGWIAMARAEREAGRRALAEAARRLDRPGAELVLATGAPAREIATFAAAVRADLIVLGVDMGAAASRRLADELASRAPCSVLLAGETSNGDASALGADLVVVDAPSRGMFRAAPAPLDDLARGPGASVLLARRAEA